MSTNAPYELYYWPVLQGRGEFVRLLLEEAQADYVDVARKPESEGGGFACIMALRRGTETPIYAPPVLRHGELTLSQVTNICFYLGQRHDLCPEDDSKYEVNQAALTIADIVAEAHDTHHPLSVALTYEEQRDAAVAKAAGFVAERMPAYFGYLERLVARGGGPHVFGGRFTYVDLSLFQLLAGLEYAFPNGYKQAISTTGGLAKIREAVAARPNIAAYLASPRRLAFNEHGIFRRYPELDIAAL